MKDKLQRSKTMYAVHIPRIVRIIERNPGITVSKINKIASSFKRATLSTILSAAAKEGFVKCEVNRRVGDEARWYVCQTEATDVGQDGKTMCVKDSESSDIIASVQPVPTNQ